MSARHFVLWADGGRTHLASRNAYRRGEASWRNDTVGLAPDDLVGELGWWDWQTPINGPFPAFSEDRLLPVASWLVRNGYTARVLTEPPAPGVPA